MKDVTVSIICIAYNHEKYIKNTIEGFLMQKTTFNYEILIHDDASTDGTAAIIQNYASRYPDKITAICQKENQYQKGKPCSLLLINQAKGKYLAFCEGDDFWTDCEKLEKQVQVLESYHECVACVHNVLVVRENGEPWDKSYQRNYYENQDKIFDVRYLRNRCKFCHTASLMMRRELFSNMSSQQMDAFINVKANGDMKWAAIIAASGKWYHIARNMACYRYVTDGNDSWSARNKGNNISLVTYQKLESVREFIQYYYNIDISYQGYYRFLCFQSMVNYIKDRNDNNYEIYKTLWKNNQYSIFRFSIDLLKKICEKFKVLLIRG